MGGWFVDDDGMVCGGMVCGGVVCGGWFVEDGV